jgi:hypothetical protein
VEVVRRADRSSLLFAASVLGFVYVLQGLRWRLIVGCPRPSRRRYVELVLAGIACNNLPERLSELYRGRLIAVEAGLPSGAASRP